jgi:hypothetical protein
VRADGVDLVITTGEGDRSSPGDRLTPGLRSAILAHKPALLAALHSAIVCPDCRGWSLRSAVDPARAGWPPGQLFWCSDRARCGRITWQEG